MGIVLLAVQPCGSTKSHRYWLTNLLENPVPRSSSKSYGVPHHSPKPMPCLALKFGIVPGLCGLYSSLLSTTSTAYLSLCYGRYDLGKACYRLHYKKKKKKKKMKIKFPKINFVC